MNKIRKACVLVGIIFLLGGTAYSQTISVQVSAGKNWTMKRSPQCAIWIEKSDGTFCQTLYVTSRAAKKSWIFAPKEGRPESLPVWFARSEATSATNKKSSDIDAITSATPKGSLSVQQQFNYEEDTTYVIKAEFNHSFDYNTNWPKEAKKTESNYSGVNGQPSIIYTGTLPQSGEIELTIEGTGNVTTKDKKIYNELEKLTTAKEIVSHIYVTVGR